MIPIDDPIGGQMIATGIRRLEIGKSLSATCDVTFASSCEENDPVPGANVVTCKSRRKLRDLLAENDILYTLGVNVNWLHTIARSGIRVILDLYAPQAFEILESWPEMPIPILRRLHRRSVRWTCAQLGLADYVLCTNESQKDFWLGMMNSIGKVNASGSRENPNLDRLIAVVPHGIPDQPPRKEGSPLRSRFPGICAEDRLLLWSSKILAWQDPVTLMQAMAILGERRARLRLVFLGTGKRPGQTRQWYDVPALRTEEAFRAAESLGLAGTNVFFVEERVPYRDIGSYYGDSDIGVATYPDTLETRLCLGSRLLDYVWAELPIITTGGKLQRDFVDQRGLGTTCDPNDPRALADAIAKMADRLDLESSCYAGAFRKARADLRWSSIVDPIVEYCTAPSQLIWPKTTRIQQAWQYAEFAARTLQCKVTEFVYRRLRFEERRTVSGNPTTLPVEL